MIYHTNNKWYMKFIINDKYKYKAFLEYCRNDFDKIKPCQKGGAKNKLGEFCDKYNITFYKSYTIEKIQDKIKKWFIQENNYNEKIIEWTKKHDDELNTLNLDSTKENIKEVADKLGRTEKAVRTRCNNLKIELPQTKNSHIAIEGNKIETIFCENNNIKSILEKKFDKKIKKIIKGKRGIKYDIKIIFQDCTYKCCQLKKFQDLNGRGNSFDRRKLENTFKKGKDRNLIEKLCLKKNITQKEKDDLDKMDKKDVIKYLKKCFYGENKKEKPNYWIFIDESYIYIISSAKLFKILCKNLNMSAKKTCFHLSENIYIQRKGGDKTDNRPDDIQIKLKIKNNILDDCDKLEYFF